MCAILCECSITTMYVLFADAAPTAIYTLSLHDVFRSTSAYVTAMEKNNGTSDFALKAADATLLPLNTYYSGSSVASAEIGKHTSELQSRQYLVCRLLLEKKKRSNDML